MNPQATHAAQRGAAFLDNFDPDWHRNVDIDRLDIRSESYCILGQLHGTYLNGRATHQLGVPDVVRMGFNAAAGGPSFAELTAAWRTEIALRLAMDNMRAGVATHLVLTEEVPGRSRGGGTKVQTDALVTA
jgi:hypothetical protein